GFYLGLRRLTVDFAKHNVLRPNNGDGVGNHVPPRHFIKGLQVGKARRAYFYAIRLVGPVGHHVDAELALGVFDAGIGFACGHVHAFGKELEVMDKVFHACLHALTIGRGNLVIVDDDRAGVVAQPFHTLANNAVAFAHFGNTNQIAVVAVAIGAHGNVEIKTVVNFVGLVLAQVPLNARATQHGAGKAQRLGTIGADNANTHQALLPDTVIGQQGFVFIHAGGETVGEVFDKVQQRTGTRVVHGAQFFFATILAGLPILRHGVGQIAVDTARTIVSGVHARTRDGLVAIHQVFAFAEGVQEYRHGAHVERVRTQRHQVVQQARDLVEHDADVLCPQRRLDAQQVFNGHHVGVFIAHHGHVVQAIHIGQRLQEGLVFGQLFGGPVQQADMRIGTLDDFAVQFQDQTQHA